MNGNEFNVRLPLKDGTKLTDDLIISRLISSRGGSSLVYLAHQGSYNVIVKEFFPLQTDSFHLQRNENGCSISLVLVKDNNIPDSFLKASEKFKNQESNAIRVISMPENDDPHDVNALFYFECKNITDEVKKQEPFKDTVSQYLVTSTVNGYTLDDYAEKLNNGKDLSLEQVLYITRSILRTVEHLHEKRNLVHLDLKPDNIFISTDIKEVERIVCFLLDLEGVQEIGNIKNIPGVSYNFASPELAALFSPETIDGFSQTEIQELKNNIGTHSDTYSVAACMFKLIVGKNYDYKQDWEENIKIMVKQSDLVLCIRDDIEKAISNFYPYLVDRITDILAKGLYCMEGNNLGFAKNFKNLRYSSCEDFIRDIDTVLSILHNDGIHGEVLAQFSKNKFADNYYFRRFGKRQKNAELISDDSLFVENWFPSVNEVK